MLHGRSGCPLGFFVGSQGVIFPLELVHNALHHPDAAVPQAWRRLPSDFRRRVLTVFQSPENEP